MLANCHIKQENKTAAVLCCVAVPCLHAWRLQAQFTVCLTSMGINQFKGNADLQFNGKGGFHSADS